MGVESDQMVFDYLSRIGDLAQTALPASQRMRLVSQLRNDIDRERKGSDSPATVRRILGRIGSPDEVVEAAAGGSTAGASGSSGSSDAPSGPSSSSSISTEGPYGPYGAPSMRKTSDKGGKGDERRQRDERRGEPRDRRLRAGDELTGLPGMTGGVFIPFDDEDLADASGDDDAADTKSKLKPKPKSRPRPLRAPVEEEEEEAEYEYEEEPAARTPRRWLPRRRGPRTVSWAPLPLLAAALLVAGAVMGSWIPLGLGWLAGYLSRQLTRRQAKFGVLGIPGTAALGLIVWVWGRDAGKWGAPIAQGQMGQAFQDAYPSTVRIAAVVSAVYLLWRARRPS